jgi:hypothetical protein
MQKRKHRSNVTGIAKNKSGFVKRVGCLAVQAAARTSSLRNKQMVPLPFRKSIRVTTRYCFPRIVTSSRLPESPSGDRSWNLAAQKKT